MRGASSLPSGVTDGTIPTDLPRDPNPVPGRLFWTGGTCVCHGGVLVVQLIRIGRIDVNRPGILGSVMGTDRVRPHHLIGVDRAQNQSR